MNPIIIEGYKGIMPLDLSGVDPIYHTIMIAQHKEDKKEYYDYQQSLPEKLRYDNTTKRALQLLEKDKMWLESNAKKKRLEQTKTDQKYYEHKCGYPPTEKKNG
jgi:hypothetical protein